jgi:2-polyprenyl-6-methoxyphenol hydroxylase-like FAD-dependent oxidoreductase
VTVFGGTRTEVLVVGAGPTGLLTALALAERGVAVEVIDEEWRPAGHSYALALHPGSLELLDDLGLAQAALAQGRRLDELRLYEGGTLRMTVRLAELGGRFPFVVALPQSGLESLLAARLAEKGVRVRWSHRLADLRQREDGVGATVQRLEKESTGYAVARTEWAVAQTLAFESAFVVGADGHRSMVRRALGASFDEAGPSQAFAIAECGATQAGDAIVLALEQDTLAALWPLPGARARWSFELAAPEVSADERFKSRLGTLVGERFFTHLDEARFRALVRERAPWFEPGLGDLGWSIEARFERRRSSCFGRDRVWLAGDAAHLTGPAGVHSMNAGLREGSDLAARLAQARGGGGKELLAAYRAEREAEWAFLLGLEGGLRPRPTAPPSVARNAARLLPCLPAGGDQLVALAGLLGLDVGRG